MKRKWIAMICIVSAGVLSAHAQLTMDWSGININNDFDNIAVGSVVLTNITSSSAAKETDFTGTRTAVSVVGFNGTGTLAVEFTAGDAFAYTNWSFNSIAGASPGNTNGTTLLSSRNGGYGLGVHTDADGGVVGRMRAINLTEVLQFSVDDSALDVGGGQLQFRVTLGVEALDLYAKTNAAAGVLLESLGNAGTSGWYDVDGEKVFAVSKANQGNNDAAGLAMLEFRVDTGAVRSPVNLSASVGDRLVQLDWAADTADELDSYKIYRSSTTNVLDVFDFYTSVTTNMLEDTSVSNDVTYYYAVSAVGSSSGETALSDVLTATPSIPVPTGLSAVSGNEEVMLDWDDATDSLFASYTVYSSTLSESNFTAIASNLTVSAYTNTALENGTTYYYTVSMVDTFGDESGLSAQAEATPGSLIVIDYTSSHLVNQNATNQYQLSDLGLNPVSYANQINSASHLGSPAVCTIGGAPGAITVTGTAWSNVNYSTWTFAGSGNFRMNSSGAGTDAKNGGTLSLNSGEGLRFAVHFDAALQSWLDSNPDIDVQLVQLTSGTGGLAVYTQGGGSNAVVTVAGGETESFSLPLTDGMEFVVANPGGGSSRLASYGFDIAGAVAGYDQFAIQYGLVEGPLGDDDKDGLSNLGEYAINGNPTNSADTGMTSLSNDGTTFTYVYASNTVDSALVYTLVDSTDLVSGPFGTNNNAVTGVGPVVDDYASVTNTYGMGTDTLFINLEVEN